MAQLTITGTKEQINALTLLVAESLDEVLEAIVKDDDCAGTI